MKFHIQLFSEWMMSPSRHPKKVPVAFVCLKTVTYIILKYFEWMQHEAWSKESEKRQIMLHTFGVAHTCDYKRSVVDKFLANEREQLMESMCCLLCLSNLKSKREWEPLPLWPAVSEEYKRCDGRAFLLCRFIYI